MARRKKAPRWRLENWLQTWIGPEGLVHAVVDWSTACGHTMFRRPVHASRRDLRDVTCIRCVANYIEVPVEDED